MSLYKQPGCEIWYYYFSHEGKRVRRSTGTTDLKEAQRIHDESKAAKWSEVGPSHNGITWKSACVAWLKAAPRSASERYSLRALDYADRAIDQCTRESFDTALGEKSAATFNRYRAMIQAILHLAGHHIKIPLRKTKTHRLRFLSREEWDRLYTKLPAHLKPLAAFAIATGLRQKNVTSLTWQQIDMRRRVAWIHPDQAKAGKPIGIPLSDEAMRVLRAQMRAKHPKTGASLKHETWVFPYHGRGRAGGEPIAKIKTAWMDALKEAGIDDFTWHGLRHTWAAWHVMSGTPLEVLQKLGGWSSYKMVLTYAHLAPEYLATYANNAKPWSSGRKKAAA